MLGLKPLSSAIFFAFLTLFQINAVAGCWESDGCRIVTGIGLGATSPDSQFSGTQRELMAIRAAKLDALRSLAEQIKGIKLRSQSAVNSNSLASDAIEAEIDATLIGVRYMKVEPIQPGIYQATAEITIYNQ